MTYKVTIENNCWPYDYPPVEVYITADDIQDAIKKAQAQDVYGDIISAIQVK